MMQSEVVRGFQLSQQQRRLWLLQQQGDAVYQGQLALLLKGKPNVQALHGTLRAIVQRYEILRTVFIQPRGFRLPLQIVNEGGDFSWTQVNLDDADSHRESEIERLLDEASHSAFNLERGPIARVVLVNIDTNRHLLIVNLPSLCADSFTLGNLARQISITYEGALQGLSEDEDPLPYAQFSEWQSDLMQDEESREGKDFWHRQSFSDAARTKLPPSAPQGIGDDKFQPASLTAKLDADMRTQVLTLSERQGTNVATLLLAVWQTLLWRLTGEREIVVGCVFDGREYEVTREAVGLFARTLPIRSHFSVEVGLAGIVAQLDEAMSQALEWQDYFSWEAHPETNADETLHPYLPFGFEFQERASLPVTAGISFHVYRQRNYIEPFHVKLHCQVQPGVLALEFQYDATLFERRSIDHLAEQFCTLLKSVVAAPEVALGGLEILSEGERRRLLVEWNETQSRYPYDTCLHELFEAQAKRTPEAIAVVYRNEQLTFLELERRANRLAHRLRAFNVGPETLVGILMERSVELIVGILGIVKAGGAYVPLDPAYPVERLSFILKDAAIKLLLTVRRQRELMMAHGVEVLCVDDESEMAKQSDAPVQSGVQSANLAYVIYTSGSTGLPKGAMIRHDAVVNLATALQEAIYYRCDGALKLSVNAPTAFDGSVKQLIQLVNGHALYIIPEELRTDAEGLLSFATQHTLDVLDCTPSQLKFLLDAGLLRHEQRALSFVLVGGEALDDRTWKVLAASERIDFYNVYGPTECTVNATICSVRASTSPPTIGRPIANVKIYLLDQKLEPVPTGMAGELCIGGSGLARGYLNRPALTAEKFIPNPFSAERGARLYKSGDFARYLPDGQLEFLGRNDFQVKLRGFRIELGEIEARLLQHAEIREALVLVREDIPGDKRLAAYVVPRPGSAPPVEELRAFLRETMPEYMVPAAFATLQKFPLTRHGKVDRNALPAPETVRRETAANYVKPRNEIEQIISSVWQEVLQVEHIGIHDNFFDLGGHSLLMMQAHTKLRAAFRRDIPIVELFKNPSVKTLAEYFSRGVNREDNFRRVRFRAEKRKQALNQRDAESL